MLEMLWPVHYDLGLKWFRMNNWGGVLEWDFVEQEKGKYEIDRRADEAITEAANNGCQIILNLSYGNWLYAAQPKKNFSNQIWQEIYDWPPHPVTPEMREGFKNYVRTMVRHFKDRVQWYEVYNEPFYGLEDEGTEGMWKLYCEMFREVAPVIREEDPKAKISVAGDSNPVESQALEYVLKYLGREGMKYVDAFGFHITPSTYPMLKEYPSAVKRFRSDAEALGFSGMLMATEYWIGTPYPPVESSHIFAGAYTEICKAKETARVFLLNRALAVLAFWCDTWKDQMQGGAGLFRNSFTADPIPPQQPEPVYYMIRTLCTIMDGAKPAELRIGFSNKADQFDNYNFSLPGKDLLVGVWLPGASQDRHPGVKTDVIVEGVKAVQVVGIDTLNGFVQKLEFRQQVEGIVVPNLLVRDYPLMIKIARE
jgi:hypothetical protein